MEYIRRTSKYSSGVSYTEYFKECSYCKKHVWMQRKGHLFCSRNCSNIATRGITDPLEFFFREKLSRLRSNAKNRKKEFDLKWEDLLELYNKQNGKCFYTGIDMNLSFSAKEENICPPEQLSVDRIDSKIGYTRDNIVLCCFCINNFKGEMSIEQFKVFLNKIIIYADKD